MPLGAAIAEAAGVARSSLYHYFAKKDDILSFLLRPVLEELTALGHSLLKPITALTEWALANVEQIHQAQASFDAEDVPSHQLHARGPDRQDRSDLEQVLRGVEGVSNQRRQQRRVCGRQTDVKGRAHPRLRFKPHLAAVPLQRLHHAQRAAGGDVHRRRVGDLRVTGDGASVNQTLEKAGRVEDFFELGMLMCRDALEREESCGGHFRVEHQAADGEAMRDDQWKIYQLVVRRFLATLSGPAKSLRTTLRFDSGGEPLVTGGTVVTHEGWLGVYPYSRRADEEIPDLNEGDVVMGGPGGAPQDRDPEASLNLTVTTIGLYLLGMVLGRVGFFARLDEFLAALPAERRYRARRGIR